MVNNKLGKPERCTRAPLNLQPTTRRRPPSIQDRNKRIEEDFSRLCYEALKNDKSVPMLRIYDAVAIKFNLSAMQVRRLVRGYGSKKSLTN